MKLVKTIMISVFDDGKTAMLVREHAYEIRPHDELLETPEAVVEQVKKALGVEGV